MPNNLSFKVCQLSGEVEEPMDSFKTEVYFYSDTFVHLTPFPFTTIHTRKDDKCNLYFQSSFVLSCTR